MTGARRKLVRKVARDVATVTERRAAARAAADGYTVTAELQAEAQSLKRLAAESAWLLIADRAQEGALAFDVPRVALQRCNTASLAWFLIGCE